MRPAVSISIEAELDDRIACRTRTFLVYQPVHIQTAFRFTRFGKLVAIDWRRYGRGHHVRR